MGVEGSWRVGLFLMNGVVKIDLLANILIGGWAITDLRGWRYICPRLCEAMIIGVGLSLHGLFNSI